MARTFATTYPLIPFFKDEGALMGIQRIKGSLGPDGTFQCGDIKISNCERGIVPWIKHIFGRNVYLDVTIGGQDDRIYVPLSVAQEFLRDKNTQRVGKTFATTLHAKIGTPQTAKEIWDQVKPNSTGPELQRVGVETVEMFLNPDRKAVDPQMLKRSQEGTKIFDFSALDPSPSAASKANPLTTKIVVEQTDTASAAIKMQQDFPGASIAVLNMANAFCPGGGFLLGHTAQEEELCRCSTLYHAIGLNPALPVDLEGKNKGLYQRSLKNRVLYSPEVQFFRKRNKDKYEEIANPYSFGVISAAAYDLRNVNPSLDVYKKSMTELIRAILRVAIRQGHKHIVLGAIGCGVFRNKSWESEQCPGTTVPEIVSGCFASVLKEDEFKGAFQNISFAILVKGERDKDNITAFKKALVPQDKPTEGSV